MKTPTTDTSASSTSGPLAGRVVIITGASSGIGAATAVRLARAGAYLVLGARRGDQLRRLAEQIAAEGGRAAWLPTDVTRRDDLQRLVAHAQEAFGRVDVLINNAGVMPLSRVDALRVEDWERMIDVNLKGVLYGIAAALPVLQVQREGHIINLSSVAAHRIVPTAAVYSATKYAVNALSEGLRQEIGGDIRVTVVSPGATESELPASITDPQMRTAVEQYRQALIPADAIAGAIEFALSQPRNVDVNELIVRPTAQEY